MNTAVLSKVEEKFLKKETLELGFEVGDTISVTYKIPDVGETLDKARSQTFKGLVIAIKGSGLRKNFTIRKISNGVGVEKIIPFSSPLVTKIKIEKKGSVRRSKLYYMRQRVGKLAMKVAEGEEIKESAQN